MQDMMQHHASIHFRGPWEAEERSEIARAAERFDLAQGVPHTIVAGGRRWVAVIHELSPSHRYCFASRIGIDTAFTGSSVSKLADAIRTSAETL